MITRGLLISGIAIIGSILAAGGMIYSEVGNPQAGMMRLFIAAFAGAMTIPPVIVALWKKPIVRATCLLYLPAALPGVASIFTPLDEDYSFFYFGLPLILLGSGLVAVLFPDRSALFIPGRCAQCGYDLRGIKSDKCPECGASQSASDDAGSIQPWHIALVYWLSAAVPSVAFIWLFVRWVMSLG